MNLLISPHNDDAALFAAFTIQHFRPHVITVFDSDVQAFRGHPGCDWETRRKEDQQAMDVLGCQISFCGVSDALLPHAMLEQTAQRLSYVANSIAPWDKVFIPASEDSGHDQHNLVSTICELLFRDHIAGRYYTYTRTEGKTTRGLKVPYTGQMAKKKLEAILCYETQLTIDALGCYPHFVRNLEEYMEERG